MKRLRTYLITGLLIMLPIVITISLFQWLFAYVDTFFIARGIDRLFGGWGIPGIGVVATVLIIILVGALGSNLLGRKIIEFGDRILHRIPFFNLVYKTLQQIVHAFSSQSRNAFQRPVLVEYPRKGLWAIAFVTGETEGEIQDKTESTVINVFMPTTPNPTSGFLLMVPKEDTIPLEMSVEDAVKMIISAGIVTPGWSERKT